MSGPNWQGPASRGGDARARIETATNSSTHGDEQRLERLTIRLTALRLAAAVRDGRWADAHRYAREAERLARALAMMEGGAP